MFCDAHNHSIDHFIDFIEQLENMRRDDEPSNKDFESTAVGVLLPALATKAEENWPQALKKINLAKLNPTPGFGRQRKFFWIYKKGGIFRG